MSKENERASLFTEHSAIMANKFESFMRPSILQFPRIPTFEPSSEVSGT